MTQPTNPNSPKGIAAAMGLAALIALTVVAAPAVAGVSIWFVILPLALAVVIVRVVDSFLQRRRTA
jgi:hypothetical protein